MSLLNSMIKAAASSLIKENPEMLNKIIPLMSELFEKSGGLTGLINTFQKNGLGDIISSWMSDGEKLPISTEQLTQVVGQNALSEFADKAGLDESIFNMLFAKGLPKVVSQMTQKGQITPEDAPPLSLDDAKDLLSKLFS